MPLCRHQIGGYTFPKDNASRKRWVTAVKRVSGNNKPWSPNSGDYPWYRPALQLCSYQICSTDTIHSWALGRFWFGIFFWMWICKTSLYYRHCKVHSSGNPTKLKCNLQTTSLSWTMQVGNHDIVSRYQFHGCNPSFSRCVVFWKSISSNLVTAKWHCAPPWHIYLISKKTCLALIW